jgi:hypothetical protein
MKFFLLMSFLLPFSLAYSQHVSFGGETSGGVPPAPRAISIRFNQMDFPIHQSIMDIVSHDLSDGKLFKILSKGNSYYCVQYVDFHNLVRSKDQIIHLIGNNKQITLSHGSSCVDSNL